jgi:hypothetical protein
MQSPSATDLHATEASLSAVIRQPLSGDQRRLQRGENQRIYSQMRRYFAPASLIPAPGSNPSQTGNRNTVLTAQNSANSTPTDSATLQLNNGVLTWHYTTKFKNPPNVTATAVGTLSGGSNPGLFLQGQGSNVAVIVKSSDATDNRLVNLHAVGAPN